jgi:hypothetical protein
VGAPPRARAGTRSGGQAGRLKPSRSPGPSGLRVFRVPVLLGVLSLVGLLSALLGDAVWDMLSWLALGIPCAVIAWFWFVARPGARP